MELKIDLVEIVLQTMQENPISTDKLIIFNKIQNKRVQKKRW